MKKDTILKQMQAVVDKYVEYWKTDFTEFDVENYKKAEAGTEWLWVVRTCGTQFPLLPKYCKPLLTSNETLEQLREADIQKQLEDYAEHAKYIVDFYYKEKSPTYNVHFFLVKKGVEIKEITYAKALESLEV